MKLKLWKLAYGMAAVGIVMESSSSTIHSASVDWIGFGFICSACAIMLGTILPE